MRHSTKLLIAAAIATVSFAGAASAADMAVKARPIPPPIFNWTGFYIGGFVGGAGAEGNATATDPRSPAFVFYNGGNLVNNYGLGSSFIGGGTAGYNWQAPGSPFVLGVEGEVGYLHLKGSRQDINAINAGFSLPDSVNTTKIGDWYGVIAGRAGWSFDRVLFYGKGGVAFVEKNYNFSDPCTAAPCGPATLFLSHSDTYVTYAVGAGIEWAFTQNWSVKGEYLYLGSRKTYTQSGVAGAGLAGTLETNSNTDPGVHTGKIGINYRFGGPIVAKY
jgi:outer membrane immunogenic protein